MGPKNILNNLYKIMWNVQLMTNNLNDFENYINIYLHKKKNYYYYN
jgi:hypothetical protein